MRNMHNQQLKIKVGPNHYSWTTNMLKIVLLLNFDQYGSRYLPSIRHLMDNQPHPISDNCNDGDKPPTTLFDNHQLAKLPLYSILVKNCYFCPVFTSMTAYSSPSWLLYWIITLHHVIHRWIDEDKPLRTTCFVVITLQNFQFAEVKSKTPVFAIFANFTPLWQRLEASHGSSIAWSSITMSFLAGLMDINFPVSQLSLFKINILLNFCQNLLFLPLSSTLNHHGRFS